MTDTRNEAIAKQPEHTLREARRRLLKGGMAGAPVVLTAMSTPVMATTCRTASRFASTPHASQKTGAEFQATKAFDLDVILAAIAKLYEPNVVTLASTINNIKLSKLIGLQGRAPGGVISYSSFTAVSATSMILASVNCTLKPNDNGCTARTLTLYQELLLLTYLNLGVPSAGTDLTLCLGLSQADLITLAGDRSIIRGGHTLKPSEVESWLRNVFDLSAGGAIGLKVLGSNIL